MVVVNQDCTGESHLVTPRLKPKRMADERLKVKEESYGASPQANAV